MICFFFHFWEDILFVLFFIEQVFGKLNAMCLVCVSRLFLLLYRLGVESEEVLCSVFCVSFVQPVTRS